METSWNCDIAGMEMLVVPTAVEVGILEISFAKPKDLSQLL